MTDYEEEQNNEIEALAAIYPEEFTLLSKEPYCFEVSVSSENVDEDGEDAAVAVTLQFTYTPHYPEEAPTVQVISRNNVSDDDEATIMSILQQQAEENLGMAMVFTMVSAVQERLNEIVDEMKQAEKEERERLEREESEREKAEEVKKFSGTPVTIETFLAWKKKI